MEQVQILAICGVSHTSTCSYMPFVFLFLAYSLKGNQQQLLYKQENQIQSLLIPLGFLIYENGQYVSFHSTQLQSP